MYPRAFASGGTTLYMSVTGSDAAWETFANTNLGVGCWVETGATVSSFTFIDDETEATSGGPAPGKRFYKVRASVR